MGANRFYERQRTLLKELDKETGLKIVCKPQRTDDAHCTVPDTLKSLKHIKVVSGISLKQFVADHATRSIVMDVPSSPLCEMINLDIDIFLIRDALSPFIPQAEELLAKRVFLFDDAAEAIKGIEKWKRGELPRLRDDSFAKRYVYRDNPKGTITGAIAAAVKQK